MYINVIELNHSRPSLLLVRSLPFSLSSFALSMQSFFPQFFVVYFPSILCSRKINNQCTQSLIIFMLTQCTSTHTHKHTPTLTMSRTHHFWSCRGRCSRSILLLALRLFMLCIRHRGHFLIGWRHVHYLRLRVLGRSRHLLLLPVIVTSRYHRPNCTIIATIIHQTIVILVRRCNRRFVQAASNGRVGSRR